MKPLQNTFKFINKVYKFIAYTYLLYGAESFLRI